MSYLSFEKDDPNRLMAAAQFLQSPDNVALYYVIHSLYTHPRYASWFVGTTGQEDLIQRRQAFLQSFVDGSYKDQIKAEYKEIERKKRQQEEEKISKQYKENRLTCVETILPQEYQFPKSYTNKRKMYFKDRQGNEHPYPHKRLKTVNGVIRFGKMKDTPTGYQDMLSGQMVPGNWRTDGFHNLDGRHRRFGDMITYVTDNRVAIWDTRQNTFQMNYLPLQQRHPNVAVFDVHGQLLGVDVDRTKHIPIVGDFWFVMTDKDEGTIFRGQQLWFKFHLSDPAVRWVYDRGTLWYEPLADCRQNETRTRKTFRLFEYDEKRVELLEDLIPTADIRSHILNFLRPQVS